MTRKNPLLMLALSVATALVIVTSAVLAAPLPTRFPSTVMYLRGAWNIDARGLRDKLNAETGQSGVRTLVVFTVQGNNDQWAGLGLRSAMQIVQHWKSQSATNFNDYIAICVVKSHTGSNCSVGLVVGADTARRYELDNQKLTDILRQSREVSPILNNPEGFVLEVVRRIVNHNSNPDQNPTPDTTPDTNPTPSGNPNPSNNPANEPDNSPGPAPSSNPSPSTTPPPPPSDPPKSSGGGNVPAGASATNPSGIQPAQPNYRPRNPGSNVPPGASAPNPSGTNQ